MLIRRIATVAGALVLGLGVLSVAPANAATKPLPVPYSFLTSAVIAGLGINADPPGANDWACKPSAAHPNPVVLVHGLTGNKSTNWQTYAPLLANNGFCVFALTYGQAPQLPSPINQVFGGFGPMEQSAAQLKTFVAQVRKATHAKKVDIVGHSEGTVIPNYYAKYLGGAKFIDKYVSLAPIWHGTNVAGLDSIVVLGTPFGVTPLIVNALNPYFASGPQLLANSAFNAKMRAGGTTKVPGIAYTNIVTRYDELVLPYTSGIEPGETNIVLQNVCPLDLSEHFQIVASPVAAALVLNALNPAHRIKVPCRLVLPFVGTL